MWKVRLINIFSNTGLFFVLPLVGTSLANAPSLHASLYTALMGLILSASREGLDYVRENREV